MRKCRRARFDPVCEMRECPSLISLKFALKTVCCLFSIVVFKGQETAIKTHKRVPNSVVLQCHDLTLGCDFVSQLCGAWVVCPCHTWGGEQARETAGSN